MNDLENFIQFCLFAYFCVFAETKKTEIITLKTKTVNLVTVQLHKELNSSVRGRRESYGAVTELYTNNYL